MAGNDWPRCNEKAGRNSRGYQYTCTRKALHNGEHVDTKNSPAYRWRDAPSAESTTKQGE